MVCPGRGDYGRLGRRCPRPPPMPRTGGLADMVGRGGRGDPETLLKPVGDAVLRFWPISKRVNPPRNQWGGVVWIRLSKGIQPPSQPYAAPPACFLVLTAHPGHAVTDMQI